MARRIVLMLFLQCLAAQGVQAAVQMQPLPPKPTGIMATLIGGDEAHAEDFPATVYISDGSGRCTATLIGPESLISAAHCMDDDSAVVFTLLTGKTHRARCRHHPDYKQNETADWALCYLDTPVLEGVTFESISMDRTIPRRGDRILLSGYGCTKEGGGGGNDGTLRVGYAEVIQVPRRGDWDIVTKGDVALCFGDSGGPAFYTWGSDDLSPANRVLVSVNSRGNIKDTSYLSKTLQNEVFSSWVRNWAAANETEICGINDVEGCRQRVDPPPDGGPKPDPKPQPEPDQGGGTPIWQWILIILGLLGGVWGVSWVAKKVKGIWSGWFG